MFKALPVFIPGSGILSWVMTLKFQLHKTTSIYFLAHLPAAQQGLGWSEPCLLSLWISSFLGNVPHLVMVEGQEGQAETFKAFEGLGKPRSQAWHQWNRKASACHRVWNKGGANTVIVGLFSRSSWCSVTDHTALISWEISFTWLDV